MRCSTRSSNGPANEARDADPLCADDGIVVNVAVTSIILSFGVALFAARGLIMAFKPGEIGLTQDRSPMAR
jgi:hypothetical protein